MDHAETVAQELIETAIRGSRMVYRTDQSRMVHDFDLRYSDGRTAAMEVTSSVDQVVQQTNAAIRNKRRGGHFIKARISKRDWYITPVIGARINSIREKADEYLAAIEAAGIDRFFCPIDCDPSVERIYRDLGVCSGSVLSLGKPGWIRIALPGGGGAVGAILVIRAIRREAFKNDNRAKLAAATAQERHLLVYIDIGNYLPWC
jgi:hypothetical protein